MSTTLPPVEPRDQLSEDELRRVLMYASTPAGLLDLLDRVVGVLDEHLSPCDRAFAIDLRRILDAYEADVLTLIASPV